MTPHWTRQLSPKAIVAGGVADIIATNILVAPVAIGIFADPDLVRATNAERTAAFTNALNDSPMLYLAMIVLGSLGSVFGGWVAARIARRAEILNGACSAFLCAGFGLYSLVRYPGMVPVWQHLAFLILAPAIGALGGIIRLRQLAARPEVPEPIAATPSEPAPSLGAGARVLLVVNRILLGLTALVAFLFALTAVLGPRGDAVFGSVLLLGVSGLAAVLYFLAGRALVAGQRKHRELHVIALLITVIPFGLLVVATSRVSAAKTAAASHPAGEIFRFTTVGATPYDTIFLGRTWLTARKYGARAGDTLYSLPRLTFDGADAIRVRRTANGVVTQLQFDYAANRDIQSIVEDYEDSLGEPAEVSSDTTAASKRRTTLWRTKDTEFRLVEFRPPFEGRVAARAFLTDLARR